MTYFPLMGEGQPYRRFDDIWFGIIFKKICDHLNYYITCGHPFIEHRKASHPLVNLVKEAPGIKMNETFWQIVDKIELTCKTPKDCMFEIGEGLFKEDDPYIKRLGQAITIWVERF
jgi:reversibly glycosylated polypeptide/UDP-arabinopyranose mutase